MQGDPAALVVYPFPAECALIAHQARQPLLTAGTDNLARWSERQGTAFNHLVSQQWALQTPNNFLDGCNENGFTAADRTETSGLEQPATPVDHLVVIDTRGRLFFCGPRRWAGSGGMGWSRRRSYGHGGAFKLAPLRFAPRIRVWTEVGGKPDDSCGSIRIADPNEAGHSFPPVPAGVGHCVPESDWRQNWTRARKARPRRGLEFRATWRVRGELVCDQWRPFASRCCGPRFGASFGFGRRWQADCQATATICHRLPRPANACQIEASQIGSDVAA